MSQTQRTLFYERHKALGAKMMEFGGWDMPLAYPSGAVKEHLATRKDAGLFDVSHMGRFLIRGRGASAFLQHVLTNDAQALDSGPIGAQYTIIANETGGTVDDAYLYRFVEGEYLLVVNAANRRKDWEHLRAHLAGFDKVELIDLTGERVMLALQGPKSSGLLEEIVDSGPLPAPVRNAVSIVTIGEARIWVGRTGYTGEPVCFELFAERQDGLSLWDILLEKGASPAGLGARDTLRLEAGLPLYGHELGRDLEGREIPVPAVRMTRSAVSFSPLKKDFIGRAALEKQFAALDKIIANDFSSRSDLPHLIRPIALTGRGVARRGAGVFKGGRQIGTVTSGTMVPYWVFDDRGPRSRPTDRHKLRPICLALVESDIGQGQAVHIGIRGRAVDAVVVDRHLRSDLPPYARPVLR